MARSVPGSGAIIEPLFNKEFGVSSVIVLNGGSGYSETDPPKLEVDNCGTPEIDALLYPIIESGRLTHVRVLNPGKGYDPLRVVISAQQDDNQRVSSFDIRSILTSVSVSITTGAFAGDHLSLVSNNLPDPAVTGVFPSTFNNNRIYSQDYSHEIVYRGGKDVPTLNNPERRSEQIGLLSNGTPLYSVDAGSAGIPPVGFKFNSVHTNIFDHDVYHGYPDNDNNYFFQDAKLIQSFASTNGLFSIKNYYSGSDFSGDNARHANGHSKVLGLSYDGYPIYGPYGFSEPLNDQSAIKRIETSYRFKTGVEVDGNRAVINTPASITYTITVANVGGINKYIINGGGFTDETAPVLLLNRGDTITFNQDDATNDAHPLALSTVLGDANGQAWHAAGQTLYDDDLLYSRGVTYRLDGSAVTYDQYILGFANATTRNIEIVVPDISPSNFSYFCRYHGLMGSKTNNLGFTAGTFIEDYIYEESYGDLDGHNGRYTVTPEYPNGTYAYFLTIDAGLEPQFPYCIGESFYSEVVRYGESAPTPSQEVPTGARAEVILSEDNPGEVQYVKMIAGGDGYFGTARTDILGGEGIGATAVPVTQSISGLSLSDPGRSYINPPSLFFQGGGGQGAEGVANIDLSGIITNITVADGGRFYQDPPFVLISGGGGIGGKAVARIEQGEVVGIDVIDPGKGYTSEPNIIFTKLINVKRKVRTRQSFNASSFFITALQQSLNTNADEVVVQSTNAFPGSGSFILGRETIEYTSKNAKKFLGCTRGTNFRYDQRVIVDGIQNVNGVSTYEFNVGDKLVRRVDNASNKVAKVYDWNPNTRELFVIFEVDELAFIDAGIPSTSDRTVAFDGGTASATDLNQLPHIIEDAVGSTIVVYQLTLQDKKFQDDDENAGAGDGIPDVVNTGTEFEDQINLDGGIYSSLYGIEETQGGTNTTLFALGDQVKDASIPFKYSTVESAGNLGDGVEHTSRMKITFKEDDTNSLSFVVGETVTGQSSSIQATVESWDAANRTLTVINPVAYFTNNVNLGIGGYFYEFSENSTVTQIRVIDPGLDYTSTPTIVVENSGELQASGTVTMTGDGDQVSTITVTNGGYGYTKNAIAGVLHPTVTFTNAVSDTTGNSASAEVILGGEKVNGAGGASWRISSIEYDTLARNE
ncbi:hypothetical protein Syn7803US110_74 [Synechococcus phage ACG-2014d]|uniref:YHYH domain-containing protein n=1 Tax=Synechococcus phage ACG-2014d TaxID=1493509 RepID=A0A0E3FEF2_9CAUD|nr:hypothetical protein Syn7803US110_74 [Synechococcus phage ACG-2014d]